MCKFWSCILTREGKVLWDKNITSHEKLVGTNGLKDAKLKNRDFVRIEITPNPPLGITSRSRSDWTYKIDEEGTLPDWYANDEMRMAALVWNEWEKAMAETLWKLQLDKLTDLINDIKSIKYLDMHGEVDPSWHIYYGKDWDAARAAARAAAGAAARAAARAAAWDAARNAVGAAAGDAAGDAAWDAAGDAAWNARAAAWNAAGEKQKEIFVGYLQPESANA